MAKRGQKSSQTSNRETTHPVRLDSTGDEGRPFADVRRTLHSVLGIISLHRWAFFAPASLVASAAFLISLYYPRLYSATTTFERRNDPVMFDLPLSAGAAASFGYFRTTMQTDLTSTAAIAEVVDNLGLTKKFPRNPDESLTSESIQRRNALARSLGSRLTIGRSSPNEQLDIIGITYTGPDPLIGKRLVEEVKNVYIRRTMTWMREFLERQRDYFRGEADVALEELRMAQRVETKLRLDHPHVNPGDPGALTAKLTQLELEHRELLMRRREHDAELLADGQMLAVLEPQPTGIDQGPDTVEMPGNPEALRLTAKRQELEKEIQNLKSTRGMTDEHPDLAERLEEIRRIVAAQEALRLQEAQEGPTAAPPAQAARAVDRAPNPVNVPLYSERARLRAHIDAQEAKIADLDVSIQTNELTTAELLKAKDCLFEHQEEFNDVMTRVSQAKQKVAQVEATLMSIEPAINAVSQDRMMQFSEGQTARSSSLPVSPKAQTVILLAAVAAALAGVIGVILAEILDHVFRSSSNVARSLGLPILEAIDEIVTVRDRRRLMVRRTVMTPLLVLTLMGAAGLSGSLAYLSLQRPWAYQQFRRLPQATMNFMGLGGPPALAAAPADHP